MIPVFFLPSVENDYEHKGCRHTCTYERGVRLPVEKKKATGQINDLTSVAIFGVTFLFSRLFFFLHVPFCRSISFRSRNPNSRGDPVDGVTLFFFLFFFSSRGRNVSWERLLSLDPLEIAGTIKRRRRYRGRVTGIEIYEISTTRSQKEMKRGNPSIPRESLARIC